jgi:hypothetical protein
VALAMAIGLKSRDMKQEIELIYDKYSLVRG